MVRFSEAVLPGHPDKLCDQIADAIVAEAYRADPDAYCQVEVSCWSDEFFLTGGIATRRALATPLDEVVRRIGRDVGYRGANAVNADRFQVRNTVCEEIREPREWTRHVNDQCIVAGYAGFDAKTRFLPPEHFLAHAFRQTLTESCRYGALKEQGPDGKLLVRLREEGREWTLEHVLVTIQQLESAAFSDVCSAVVSDLRDSYGRIRAADRSWVAGFEDVEVVVNPNGPLVNGGPDGDNGQTGRKLVMDFYGPRVPIGGGALSGKDLTHIDRAGNYAARQAAMRAVASGAEECLIRTAYAPNLSEPLEVVYEMTGRGERLPNEWFSHRSIVSRMEGWSDWVERGQGDHFSAEDAPWNGAERDGFTG